MLKQVGSVGQNPHTNPGRPGGFCVRSNGEYLKNSGVKKICETSGKELNNSVGLHYSLPFVKHRRVNCFGCSVTALKFSILFFTF